MSTTWTTHQLTVAAAVWLRYKKQVQLVAFESGAFGDYPTKPDVFGVDASGTSIEIEVKVSVSDFLRDRKKKRSTLRAPHLFYYLTPPEIAEKIKDRLPSGAGLMVPQGRSFFYKIPDLASVVRATRNKSAAGIRGRYFWEMLKAQSSTLCRLAADETLKRVTATLPKDITTTESP